MTSFEIGRKVIAAAVPFAHKKPNRYAMNTVRVFDKTAEATNGKQLIRATDLEHTGDGAAEPTLLPLTLAKAAAKSTNTNDETVVTSDGSSVAATTTQGTASEKAVAGFYPPTDEVWPETLEQGVEFGMARDVLEGLLKAMKAAKLGTVKLWVDGPTKPIHFACGDASIKLEGILMPVQLD